MSDNNTRFERDADLIAQGKRPEDFETLPDEYRAMLITGERVSMAAYPAARHALKARIMQERSAPMRRSLLVPVGAALALLVMGLVFSVGPALAEALVTMLTVGERTTVNVVDGDFEATIGDDGEVVIVEAGEHAIPAEGEYDPDTDDPYIEGEYVPYEASFALSEPGFLPEGVTEGKRYAGERGSVVIEYSNGTDWLLSLTQGPNGSTVSTAADMPVVDVTVNGADGLYIAAEMGEGLLVWEAEGTSFQLFSSRGDLGLMMQIAESIH